MADQWYYSQNDQRHGPVSTEQLKQLANSGQLKSCDLIWKQGMKNWVEAGKATGLIPPELADAPPPLPKSLPAVHVAPTAVASAPTPEQAEDAIDFLSATSAAQPSGKPTARRPAETAPAPADESNDVAALASSATRASAETTQARFKKKAKGMFGSLAATGKAAGQLIAKQTERTFLLGGTLPSAYEKLGRHVYDANLYRTEFAEQYSSIDKLLAEKQALETQPKGTGMAGKAKAAGRAVQLHTLWATADQALKALGQAVYEQHGEQSGPEELVRPIADHRSRLTTLNAEITRLSEAQKGQLLTPKRLAIGAAVAVGLFVLWAVGSVLSAIGSTSISADFLPCKPGSRCSYNVYMFPDGKEEGCIVMGNTYEFEDGVVHISHDRLGRLENGHVHWISYKRTSSKDEQHRVRDGFVEVSMNIEPVGVLWQPVLKIGAKVGDKWERVGGTSKFCYTVEKFGSHSVKADGSTRPSVTIKEEIYFADSTTADLMSYWTYAKNLGLVQQEYFKDGKQIGKWELDDIVLNKNSTASERAFYNVTSNATPESRDADSVEVGIDAKELIGAFDNEAAGVAKYSGKQVKVQGEVMDVKQDYASDSIFASKQYAIELGGDLGPDGYSTWVQCFVPNAKDASSVRPGGRVSVLGTVQDHFHCVLRMTNCKVLEQ